MRITIKEIKMAQEGTKAPHILTVSKEGSDKTFDVKVWQNHFGKMGTPLVVGATDDADIEKKEGTKGEEFFLNSFGPKKFGGGGGGRPMNAPKTPAEIHSASLCGIIKSCIEHGKDHKAAEEWIALYTKSVKSFGGGA